MTERGDSHKPGRGFRQWFAHLPFGMIAGVTILGIIVLYFAAPINVAARIGKFPGFSWVLHTYMKQWAQNWSAWVEKPAYLDLSDPALIRLGAGYFESGCAACHGAPGRERNPIVELMEPPPPALAPQIPTFSDNELYWIIWNGIRYTAMPGWTGNHREDEVWAMVAFLRNYGSLSPQDYVRLAYGDIRPSGLDGGKVSFGGPGSELKDPTQNCARCHGDDGLGRDGTAPKIAGQSKDYLAATLAGYASGVRSSGFMQPIAAALSEAEITTLAEHYAALPATGTGVENTSKSADTRNGAEQAELKTLGQRLATGGDPSRFVPVCNSCHEDGGAVSPRLIYPRIAGQESRFIESWLRFYRDRPLGGTSFANVMHVAAAGLTDREIEALALWYSSQPYTGVENEMQRQSQQTQSGASGSAPAP